MIQEIEGFSTGGSTSSLSFVAYYSLPGEIEARNVEARRTLDPEIRRQFKISDTEDMRMPRHHVTRGPARDPAAILEALVAARILAGKTPTTEEVSAILRNVGSPDADPAAILTAATTRAKTSAATALASAKLSEREIFESLATDAQRDRLTSRLDATFHQGAAYAEPGIDAAVAADRLADKTAKLAILSAAGYTAAEMQSELGVDLAAATLAMPPRVLTPEEQAALEEARKKRLAEQDAAEAEAEALSLAEGQAAITAAPPSPQMQALVADLLARARTRVEAQRLEDQRKRLDKASAAAEAGASASDSEASTDAADAAEAAALDLSEAEVTRLVAPALADPDEFAAFIFEWSRQRIARDRPHLKPDRLFRDPAALRDLARTAQHILRGLATDLLPFGQTREVALRNIDDLEHARTDRRILRQIAFIYSRIQATAQKHTRETLIADLETTITRLAKEPGRFIPQREDLKRRVTAAVETFARNLLSYIHLTPAEIEAETRRLQDIIAKADAEETSTGYAKTQDREFRRAIDQLAVLAQYGGMASWMPGKISDASEVIIEQLSGARAEHEARIAAHEAAAARMSGTLSGAIMRSDADLRPDPGALARFADSLIGNVRLRLNHLIRFAPAGKTRTDAETTIEDVTVILGEGATRYRTTQAEAHAALNAALTEIYGNALDAVRHLDTPIPADISRQLSHQGEPLTFGQAIQLYGSIIQRDYRDNVRRHGRAADLPILRAVLSETDMRLHLWMVQYYATRREALSQAQQEITGLPILSPDQFYIPVRMRIDPTGFRGRHASWSPILKSLTPRIRNRRDFDERTSILDVFADSLQDAALITAYGARGIFLRELFGSEAVQGTIERWHGKAARAGLIDQIEDTLRGGRQITKSDSFLTAANKLRRWTARFYLSGNVASALKQTASIPVWANVIGFRDLGRYLVDIDPEAVRALMQSPGFAARYSAGWSEETANILSETHRTAIARAYDKGLLLNSAMDAFAAIWIGQGLYRDLKARFLDEGRPEPEATSRAQTIVWSLIEETQQSARTENLPRFMREGGGMTRFVTQFILSPLQQLAFEVEAIREAHAGTPGSKAKLARALIINHLIVPAIFQAINAGWSALLGFPPDDDDKKKRQKWAEIITASLIGQFGAIFLVGNMAEQGILTLLGGKPRYGSSGAIPAESIGRVLTNSIKTLTHAGQIGINLLTPTDLFEVTTDDLLADLDRLAGNISAPYRHISQAVHNRSDE
jgi:hypothetical protein